MITSSLLKSQATLYLPTKTQETPFRSSIIHTVPLPPIGQNHQFTGLLQRHIWGVKAPGHRYWTLTVSHTKKEGQNYLSSSSPRDLSTRLTTFECWGESCSQEPERFPSITRSDLPFPTAVFDHSSEEREMASRVTPWGEKSIFWLMVSSAKATL